MIRRLRTKFIRIAMLSVALVLLLLCLIVNAANFAATNRDLDRTLAMICENQGTIPMDRMPGTPPGIPPEKPTAEPEPPKGPFTAETPYSTRYFYLRLDADGAITGSDFSHIAAVTEDDAAEYAQAALRRGAGSGYYASHYKYRVVAEADSGYTAVFLDCYQSLRAARQFALWSGVSCVVCLALVYGLVVLFSRRAIDPVVRASERQKQFITDAGHELKTPITVIGTSLKVL